MTDSYAVLITRASHNTCPVNLHPGGAAPGAEPDFRPIRAKTRRPEARRPDVTPVRFVLYSPRDDRTGSKGRRSAAPGVLGVHGGGATTRAARIGRGARALDCR